MDEKRVGQRISASRRARGLTQDGMAELLGVTAQAISKWENGHSLPETALLPALARALDLSLDALFDASDLVVIEAWYGDGIEKMNVTDRLSRLVLKGELDVVVGDAVLGARTSEDRTPYLIVSYETGRGICRAAAREGDSLHLTEADSPSALPERGLRIVGGTYGTRAHAYDVMGKIEHYRAFNWTEYSANHETFPSLPANDGVEYLTLIYENLGGLNMATCAEGESLIFGEGGDTLARRAPAGELFIPGVPELPPFGKGMECSWGAALTAALRGMGERADYERVMGVSGACYRVAFSSPTWDYSSVDGLVAYDYATPGYAAFGYTPEMYSHIEKQDRPGHRARILNELKNNMPVLGINLRVAAEWGIICGCARGGEELYCRTKYDRQTIENDPELMAGHAAFDPSGLNEHGYMPVDNWPFLLCYFKDKRKSPSARENLIGSLAAFVDGFTCPGEGSYSVGEQAYAVWARDLRDEDFYARADSELIGRRFSVNQFCALALDDARRAAAGYLSSSLELMDGSAGEALAELVRIFAGVSELAGRIQRLVETDRGLNGEEARAHWTADMREKQAGLLCEIARLERSAVDLISPHVRGRG